MVTDYIESRPGLKSPGLLLRVLGCCLLLLMALMVTGCDFAKDSHAEKYKDESAVAKFLKKNYFEVQTEPIQFRDFEYTLLDGRREMLSSNRGKVVFLNFWAIWCYPCRKEMPDLEVMAKGLKNEPFRILAVNFGDTEEQVRRFADRFKYHFDIAMDMDKSIASALAVSGLPTTMIIDKQGRLLARLVGPANWKNEEFRYLFQALSRK